MKLLRQISLFISPTIFSCLLFTGGAVIAGPEDYTENRVRCKDHAPLMQPFFGDFHVHTRYSLDASTQGTRTTPDQAYRFALGEQLGIQPWDENGEAGRALALSRPLDFAMVSDHAELIGEVHMCRSPEIQGYSSWQCMIYRNWPRGAFYLFNYMATMQNSHMGQCGEGGQLCLDASLQPWTEMQQAAEAHYDRSSECNFTAFVGYEWTGMEADSGGNLHRNVVFRNAEVPQLPRSFIDGPSASQLWASLDEQCIDAQGNCDSLIIPHNANLSAGFMYSGLDDNGAAMTAEYARTRKRHEPLAEIMQHKGSSECYFKAGESTDELCEFEQLAKDNIAGYSEQPKPETGFLRKVLRDGMLLQRELGVNPYQFGIVASTDTHLGTPGAADEDRFLGHGGAGVPAKDGAPPGLPDKLEYNPGGLAVVWAQENSRDALFNSLRRRETYGTSGPRIISRFFAGWDYSEDMCASPERVKEAYAAGVPMGSELPPSARVDAAPRFALFAGQDAGTAANPGTPLQRLQIIKGWIDEKGEAKERVIDVAGSANNGASVDTKTCQTSGDGYASLCAVWRDDQFNPGEQAYYYSRVVENPTCRWSQRICAANAVDCNNPKTITDGLEGCCASEHRPVVQERAWSSPIWYQPG